MIALLVFPVFSGAFQADEKLKSGPQAGEFLPGAFHFLNINGVNAGSPHCLVCEYGLKPVVAVFTREIPSEGQPLMDLLKKLDEAVAQHQKAELQSFVVFLSKDYNEEAPRKKLVKSLEALASSRWKQLVASVGPPEGPENYNLNKDAEITVLLYYKHKVAANFAFAKDKLTDKEVTAIVSAVNNFVPKK
jgi:hypothetical protein